MQPQASGEQHGHRLWLEQLKRLHHSIRKLSDTSPSNIMEHFFSQAMSRDFPSETDEFKTTVKKMRLIAVLRTDCGNIRQTAAAIVAKIYPVTFRSKIQLADIRNLAVFQVYCKCGVTVDTYFERFSSPPGTPQENAAYATVAHGNAMCNAETTQKLSDILLFMQYLKRVLCVKKCLKDSRYKTTAYTLNWMGTMWSAHIRERNLSLLIWELFLDLHYYKAATISLR